MNTITSTQNPLVKETMKIVQDSSFAKEKQMLVFDGVHMAKEALAHLRDKEIEKVFVLLDCENQEIQEILSQVQVDKIVKVSKQVLAKISPTKNSQGIMVLARRPSVQFVEKYKHAVFLERISDPGNVGAIIRTAVAMGVETVLLSPGCCDVWSAKCLRASQGAHLYIDIIDNCSLEQVKKYCSGNILTTELNADAQSLYDVDLSISTVWVFGNEGSGVSQKALEAANVTVFIPMANNFESLNVATCAAICLAEQQRQLSVSAL